MSLAAITVSAAVAGVAFAWAMGLALRHAWWVFARTGIRPADVARLARRDGVSRDAVRTRMAVAARARRGR